MITESAVRAENLGSLLQSDSLLEARRRQGEGLISAEELAAIEDREILEAIALQESVGLDVITDGEFRREGWSNTARFLTGLEQREGERSYPISVSRSTVGNTTVVGRVTAKVAHPAASEYAFLAEHAHRRTKYTIAAPSFHRRYWQDEVSPRESGYATCEEYLTEVRDWIHSVAAGLAVQGCTYIQLDAPNYGWYCDPTTRAFHAEHGHNVEEIVAFDAALDSSVFDGLEVTRALHVCRGNGPNGVWHSQGGYGIIAEPLFANLAVDVVLLEYDSDRAGDFAPLKHVKPGTVAVLGLLTTKDGRLEDESEVRRRIEEAAGIKPVDELALSTQCGFASAANAPMTESEQRAKLSLVASVARRVWG